MLFALSICCALIFSVVGQQLPTVNIAQGTVVGSIADDGDYFKFYGIPYADSTSGSHRFKVNVSQFYTFYVLGCASLE